MVERSRPQEPAERRAPRGPGWRVLLAAAALAGFGALVAPEPWPAGEGTVELVRDGRLLVSAPLEIGTAMEVKLSTSTENLDIAVRLQDGVPVEAPTTATIKVQRGGREIRPSLGEFDLVVVLPDGRREPVPVLRWDAEGEYLVASRRPPVDAAAVLALLGVVVVLWVTEALPLFVTSLAIPVVLGVVGAGTGSEVLAPFFHPVIALFFGGFLMAEAMRRVDLDRLAAVSIVATVGRGPVALFAAMLAVSAFLSMWMSNTAAVAVLIPVAMAVTGPLESEGYRKAIVLGIAYAATIGGVGSAIGTPANPIAIAFLDDFVGRKVSFVEWFAFGLPMVVLFLPVMAVYLWRRSDARPDGARFEHARRVAREELGGLGRLNRSQLTVLAVFAGVATVWLTQTWHGLDTGLVAIGGAVVLALLGKVLPEDLGRISWASLLTFGGGLTLGLFLVDSGASDWLATRLGGLAEVPGPVALTAIALLALGLTTVASNTATAAMLIPLAIPLAGIVGLNPVLVVAVVAIASSIDFALVVGTPPTMLAYSTKLFTAREILRKGLVLDLIGIVLLVGVVSYIWELTGVT